MTRVNTCRSLDGAMVKPDTSAAAAPDELNESEQNRHADPSSHGGQQSSDLTNGPSRAADEGPSFKERELELVNFELGMEVGEESGRSQLVDVIVILAVS